MHVRVHCLHKSKLIGVGWETLANVRSMVNDPAVVGGTISNGIKGLYNSVHLCRGLVFKQDPHHSR